MIPHPKLDVIKIMKKKANPMTVSDRIRGFPEVCG
jgi:hypothetical protein